MRISDWSSNVCSSDLVPAIKPAADMTHSGVIGVLGTEATVRQPYVDDLSARFAAGKTVLRHGSPGLVTAAEAKLRGQAVDPTRSEARRGGQECVITCRSGWSRYH